MSKIESLVDWSVIETEAIQWLQELIRIDTTNPPGNEALAVEWMGEILLKEKIPFKIVKTAPHRANLIARLKGDESEPPLLLTAHLDTVRAQETGWSHPPFSGDIADGCLWGRGALDMKDAAVMFLAGIILLKRYSIELKRDIIFAAVADEEQGCALGSQYIVDHHPELVRAEYSIGEVGGHTMEISGKRFYLIQVAEKGVCWLKLTFKGVSAHGSLPAVDNALAAAGKIAAFLDTHRLSYHLTLPAQHFIQTLGKHLPFPKSIGILGLLNPTLARVILDKMPDQDIARSMTAALFNTANPTILNAGHTINVIPEHAELRVDGRTLPGISEETFVEELDKLIGGCAHIEVEKWMPATQSPMTSPLLQVIYNELKSVDPDAIPLPYLMPGYTDSKQFSRLGTKHYGFVPLSLPANMQFQSLFHGVDERIPLKSFTFGVRLLTRVLYEFCLKRYCEACYGD